MSGTQLRSDDPSARSEAARMMGLSRSDKKIAAAQAVAASRRGSKWTEEQKEGLRLAQQARRQREREEQAAVAAAPGTPRVRRVPPSRKGAKWTDEQKAGLALAQQERRKREREEREPR